MLTNTLYLSAQNSSLDNKPKISGRVVINSEIFTSNRDSFPDVLEFADVRIGLKGTIDDNWYYKIDISYADNRVTAKDVFFGYRKNSHQLQVGQFYEPYSLGYLVSSVDGEFQQVPSSVFTFGNSRKLGFSYTYDVKRFNFTFVSFTQSSVESAANPLSTYTVNSRFIYRPVYRDNCLLHLAVAPAWKKLNGLVEYYSPGFMSSNIQKIAQVQLNDANSQFRLGVESYFSINKFSAKFEYVYANIFRDSHKSFFGQGCYLELSYIPWGEPYNYDSSWGCLARPKGNFLELVVRCNYLDLNDSKAEIYGGSHQDFSFGVNWYITKHVAVKCSYNYLLLHNSVNTLLNAPLSSFQFRMQFVL